MSISLIVASQEPHFREFVREHLAHTPGAKLASEHEEVGLNLYVRILHDLERNPHAAGFYRRQPRPGFPVGHALSTGCVWNHQFAGVGALAVLG